MLFNWDLEALPYVLDRTIGPDPILSTSRQRGAARHIGGRATFAAGKSFHLFGGLIKAAVALADRGFGASPPRDIAEHNCCLDETAQRGESYPRAT